MGKKVLVTGGTGLIGKQLIKILLAHGYEVATLIRKKKSIPNVSVYEWNVGKGYIEDGALNNTTHLIHLAGASIADARWTASRKKEILESRTKTTELLAKQLVCQKVTLDSFISASGISIYGTDTGDKKQTENDSAGNDFLSQVTIAWEKAADLIANTGVRTIKLRTGIVLSEKGGALPKMALPAKFGLGASLGSGRQWVSWIHIKDLCNLYLKALTDTTMNGAYNAVAPEPVTNKDLTAEICKALHRPQWLPAVPAFALRLALGEMADTVLGSNYILNQRIVQETSFEYQFPTLRAALTDIYR